MNFAADRKDAPLDPPDTEDCPLAKLHDDVLEPHALAYIRADDGGKVYDGFIAFLTQRGVL